MKMIVSWDVSPCSLVEIDRRYCLMMEAVSTSETSVSFYLTTRRNIQEDNHLHTRHHENLQSHCSQINTKTIKEDPNFSFLLPQEQARLLTVGSTETREPTCPNTAQCDLGLGASVAFGL
jgi:hypothetical protein